MNDQNMYGYGPSHQQPHPASPAYHQQAVPAPIYAQPSSAVTPPVLDTRARTAGIVFLVTAAVVLVGVVARSWFTSRGDATVGLLGIEECRRFACESITWFDVKRAPTEIKMFSAIGLLAALTAVGFMIHAGVVLIKGAARRVNQIGLNISLGLALFGCLSFFLHMTFGELSKRVAMSWAGFLAIGGLVTAAVILQSWIRPLAKSSSR